MTEPAPGQHLASRFRLDRLLGQGGMGQVWLAHDEELDEPVAVKILDAKLVGQAGMLELLRHECRQARRLVHPNIVRVFDFHQDDEHAFISMEYVRGGELGQLRDASPVEILRHIVPLADALAYAHAQGVVHRDLKPSNVLIDPAGEPRLVDFGVAGLLQGEGLTVSGGGSPLSMSPEQRAGQPPSPADDAFSLGVLIYELVAGFPPRVGDDLRPPEPLHSRRNFDIPERLERLVGRLLSPEAAGRPASMAEVRDELDTALQESWSEPAATDLRVVSSDTAADEEIVPIVHRQPPAAVRTEGSSKRGSAKLLLWSSFAALIALLLAVVFVLPDMVAKRGGEEVVDDGGQVTSGDDAAVAERLEGIRSAEEDLARLAEEKAAAAEARLMFDETAAALVAIGVEAWAASAYADAQAQSDAAALAFDGAEFVTARETWEAGTARLQALEARALELLAGALERGADALARGRGEKAMAEFDAAPGLDPGNAEALAGKARAANIDRVFELLDEGQRLERAGDYGGARERYAEAAALDPLVPGGADGVKRVDAIMVEQGFVNAMSRGYAALGSGDFAAARRGFSQAARIRPGASEPVEALARVEEEERVSKITAHQQLAGEYEQQERWADAVAEYREALVLDAGLAFAQVGVSRAGARAELDERLQGFIDQPERIYSSSVYSAAAQAVQQARAYEQPGSRLVGQIQRIEILMAEARKPVMVQLESDEKTEVVVYRVGRLGIFDRFELELRPGTYTAVGTRNGYRDVRREFTVRPGAAASPVVIRCEEPI